MGYGSRCHAPGNAVHSPHSCVSGLKGQLCQPGMKCQVRRTQCPVALQGQLLAGPCRVMGGPRGELRGGAMVDLLVPGSPVGCRGPGSGNDANANPDTTITCNRTARSQGEAKSWPYRPKGRTGWVPGIASRAG